jgi:hypothetical protein
LAEISSGAEANLTPCWSFRTAYHCNIYRVQLLHIVVLYILYAESISPCVSATANTLQSQAAVRAKSYCVALHDGAKSYCVTLHDGHNGALASASAHIISGTRKIWSPYSSTTESLYTCISFALSGPKRTTAWRGTKTSARRQICLRATANFGQSREPILLSKIASLKIPKKFRGPLKKLKYGRVP